MRIIILPLALIGFASTVAAFLSLIGLPATLANVILYGLAGVGLIALAWLARFFLSVLMALRVWSKP
jgi:hypothetical protein